MQGFIEKFYNRVKIAIKYIRFIFEFVKNEKFISDSIRISEFR